MVSRRGKEHLKKGLKEKQQTKDSSAGYNDLHPQVKKAMVVARYNEDLTWLKNVPATIKIFLYNKGKDDLIDLPDNVDLIKLPNIGRESHTYLHHVITNFYSLNEFERIIFVQGDPFDHKTDINYLINGEPGENSNIIGKCSYVSISQDSAALEGVTWKDSKWNIDHSSQTLSEYFKDPLYHNHSFNNDVTCMVFGANFAAYTSDILCHDLSYHQRVFLRLQTPNPKEGHFMERAWNEWANCKNQNISYTNFVINMDRSTERLKSFSEQMSAINEQFTRFRAVNGYQVKIKNLNVGDEFYGYDLKPGGKALNKDVPYKIICNPGEENETMIRFIGSYNDFNQSLSAGELGLWCSNKMLWEKIENDKYPYVVIYEDDSKFLPDYSINFNNYINFLPKDFDIAYIRQWKRNGDTNSVAHNKYVHTFSDNFSGWGTDAIIFSQEGIKKLNQLNNNLGYMFGIDIFYWCAITGNIIDVEKYHRSDICDPYKGLLKAYGSNVVMSDVLHAASEIKLMGRGDLAESSE